ncbi:putative polyketide synthase [Lepidopterella palustris CBS 459.81]|uniref:Putative polyketide synthase n=1 Tax=Lepidopterella palustris CBS 459.81 TaxID=1314670 RepID=A0A8E2E1V1_9PEZI|nr:putative polyketide synthase [Lepidopterella palustris CBS 459.81]
MALRSRGKVLQPRVRGTMSLHTALRRYTPHLEFFILLSTISAIVGIPTQANYAAASSYMDVFASFLNSLGLPAISFNIGMVLDVG